MKRIAVLLLTLACVATGASAGAAIEDVRERHAGRLMEHPGVVSVGIGRDAEGRAAIVIGLDRERPRTRQALPAELEGHPVRVRIVGRPRAD